MRYRRLGNTELQVSILALGCWALAGDFTWGPQDEEESVRTILAALDAGINFFDTAEAYGDGRSEEILGKALEGRRDSVVLATKVSPAHLRRDQVVEACEASLRRLRTDRIDLYQIHWANREVPFSETAEALVRLCEAGKIRAVGVSNFGVQDLADLSREVPIVSNQLPYSLLWRAVEYEILPFCRSRGVAVLAYSPLLHGLLTGKYRSADEVPPQRARTRHFSSQRPYVRHGEEGCEELTFQTIANIGDLCSELGQPMGRVAIAWVLAQDGVTAAIVGARRPQQIQELVSAADLELPDPVIDRLNQLTHPLKERLGRNPDMWQSESRYR